MRTGSTSFRHDRKLKDGDRITVGNIALDVLHTPGHTPEHLTFLVTDGAAADQPIAAVTGDFIFVGDVGRPDLLERAANIKGTMEAGRADAVEEPAEVCVARGLAADLAGPRRRFGVRQGHQRHSIVHARLRDAASTGRSTSRPKTQFVSSVLAGQPEPPKYFATMKRVNKEGPAILGGFHVPDELDAATLPELLARKALVIDTRPAAEYAAGHLPGTINIPLNASFVTWAGWLVQTRRVLPDRRCGNGGGAAWRNWRGRWR